MNSRCRLAVLVSAAVSAGALAQTAGTVQLSFQTKRTSGKYAPKHVLAVWVTNARGEFVRTLAIYGRKQAKRLKGWSADSSRNTTHATTGATLRSHAERTVTWDCRSASGALVPDGDYHLRIEFAESNRTTVLTPAKGLLITKGPQKSEKKHRGSEQVSDISITYTPATG